MQLNKLIIPLFFATTGLELHAAELNTDALIEPVLVNIPAGSFEMGSKESENSQPLHRVNIKQFSLGKYEVTVKEFRSFVKATGYEMPAKCYHQLNTWFGYGETDGTWQNNSLNTSDFQPVNCIGWKAANAYTQWLAKETGKPYRLPSEAEWEYAARAGTSTRFYFGDDAKQTLVCQYENTADLTGENILQRDSNTSYVNFANGKSNCVDHSAYASIVGMYKANPFGVHDMLSNVVEFLADCYQENYQNAPVNGQAVMAENCERRSTRGASWHWNTFETTRRSGMEESFVGGVEGFRIALDGAAPNQSKTTQWFAAELKTAQEVEQQKRNAMLPYPDPVTNLKLTQLNGLVTLSWDKSKQSDVSGYRVYRNDAAGSLFKLLAANIVEPNFKDANADQHKYEYMVVAVRRHQQSDYSNVVATEAPVVQLPGRIEAEAALEISGSSVTRTSDVDGGFNLTGAGGIADNAKIDYQVEVAKTGQYTFSYRVAATRDTKGFSVLVNDKEMTVVKVANTGGNHEWQTQIGNTIHLEKGRHKLTLKSLDNNWKLNWLMLNPAP